MVNDGTCFTISQEKEMKKNADSILSEVKKKLASSQKALNILKSLRKLRQIRKDNAVRKGAGNNSPGTKASVLQAGSRETLITYVFVHYKISFTVGFYIESYS